MIIDEAVYLEHHGVKGQKWGVRKKKTSGDPERDSVVQRRKRVAVVVGIGLGAAVAAGSIYAIRNQKVSALKNVPVFQKKTKAGKIAAKGFMNRHGSTPVSPELRSRALAARANAAAGSKNHDKIMKRVAANHLESVKATNTNLKTWFNDSNTPFKQREYLDTSYWENILN